ncbi:hypothetical protein [Thermosulfurimonas sp. F29]|uniref:hypothetical protein n=1 Tax=Thermosulfurimonas sp. F29 TaxID=2867247 RepID=UPI001C83AB48|nr:hypothetical protein [Thermosulfurimonas sp. F29]MBX6424231.1 hypothetical protein [Thermosulfurimonas sp. F29]
MLKSISLKPLKRGKRFSLKNIFAKPLAIDHEGVLYSAETGERIPPTEAGRYRILHVTSVRSHVVRDRPAGRFPYTYRTRDGRYMMASTLTLPFLRDAVTDHRQISAVLFTTPAMAIACLGHRYEVVHLPRDPAEAREALDRFASNFYQGVQYAVIPLEKAITLVQPRTRKPLIVAAIAGFILCLSFLLGGGGEETPNLPPPPPPGTQTTHQPAIDPRLIAVCRTKTIILRAFREGLRAQRDMGFLGDIGFDGGGRLGLYYLLPLTHTRRANDFYVRTITVTPTATAPATCNPGRLSPTECLARLVRYHPDIEGQSAAGFILRFTGTYTTEKTARLLATLADCPAEVHGNVVFRNPFERDLSLRVTVMTTPIAKPSR